MVGMWSAPARWPGPVSFERQSAAWLSRMARSRSEGVFATMTRAFPSSAGEVGEVGGEVCASNGLIVVGSAGDEELQAL